MYEYIIKSIQELNKKGKITEILVELSDINSQKLSSKFLLIITTS